MAQVEISVNGHSYRITCTDGQESRLQDLAAYFDRNVAEISGELGSIGEPRLFLLAALTVCDELYEARARIADLENAGDLLDSNTSGAAARAVEAAVAKLNELSKTLDVA